MSAKPNFRIYLATPPAFDPLAFLPVLLKTVEAADVACVEIALDEKDEGRWRSAVDRLRAPLQDRGVAVLLVDQPHLAAGTGCDGVRLSSVDDHEQARRIVGPNAIVGVATGLIRHDAMVAGENGADFVALAGDPDLIAWWAELFEVPCVAVARDLHLETLNRADFICPGPQLWSAGPVSEAPQRLRNAVAAAVSRA